MSLRVHESDSNNDKPKDDKLNFSEEYDSQNFHNKIYEGGKDYTIDDLDKDLSKIFDDPFIDQVQIIAEIIDPETGIKSYISQTISPEDYERIDESGMSIYDYFDEELGDDDRYSGCNFVPGGISVRVMS